MVVDWVNVAILLVYILLEDASDVQNHPRSVGEPISNIQTDHDPWAEPVCDPPHDHIQALSQSVVQLIYVPHTPLCGVMCGGKCGVRNYQNLQFT